MAYLRLQGLFDEDGNLRRVAASRCRAGDRRRNSAAIGVAPMPREGRVSANGKPKQFGDAQVGQLPLPLKRLLQR